MVPTTLTQTQTSRETGQSPEISQSELAAHSPSTHPALRYRPDIDGLRALAVVVVILFHARLGCPGGYVGVDVFFVISGFLITSLLLRDLAAEKFSMADFWERRFRRIAPALIATLAVSMLTAWFILLPDDFESFGRAVISQITLTANIHHWRVAGYFGPAAERLPLLHTWSLAVEEQFYLFLPLTLWLIARWRHNWLPALITIACICSFALSVWGTPKYPSASFFLLPTRAWELLLGSLLAISSAQGTATTRWIREVAGWGGLIAILGAVAFFDSKTLFPGATALLPCLGAVAIIWAGRQDGAGRETSYGRLLSWKPFVFIGGISYSLYLVHWPLLVYAQYWSPSDYHSTYWSVVLVAATFLLGALSWLVVETPFRKKWVLRNRKGLFLTTAGAMAIMLAGGVTIVVNQGFPSRFDPRVLDYIAGRKDKALFPLLQVADVLNGKLPVIGDPQGDLQFLLWGDSHAGALAPVLDELGREGRFQGLYASYSDTSPLLGFISNRTHSLKKRAPEFNEAIVRIAIARHPKFAILAANWPTDAANPQFVSSLKETVQRLTSAGIKVVIVRTIATQPSDVPWTLARAAMRQEDVRNMGLPIQTHRDRNKLADQAFGEVAGPDVIIVDPAPFFVDGNGLWKVENDGKPLYSDSHHLSVQGARQLKKMFEPIF